MSRCSAALAAALVASCGASQKAADPEPAAPVAAAVDAAPERTAEDIEAEQIAAIEYAVNTTGEAVHACYKRATAERLAVDGVVVLGVEFGDGGAPKVAVISDEPNSPVLGACLVDLFTAFQWPPVFEAGDAIQLPLSFVAATAQYTVHSGHVTVRDVAPGLQAAVVLDADSTGNDAAALTLLKLGAGFEVPMHTHTSAEILYVLEGGGVIYGARGKAKGTAAGAGSAVYIPAGVAHGFSTGEGGAQVVQLYAPGGAEQRFEGDTARKDTTPVSAAEARKLARKRTAPAPRIARLADAKRYEIAGGKGAVRFLFDEAASGDKAAYIGVLTAQPGLKVPAHTHDGATELLYVLSGRAVMTVAGVEHPVEPGMGVQIPPGALHDATVTSDEELEVLQFYTPAGPEQRFKK